MNRQTTILLVVMAALIHPPSAALAAPLDLTQNTDTNIAIIAPGSVSTDIHLSQTGRNSSALASQAGPENALSVTQNGTSNRAAVTQSGSVNSGFINQSHDPLQSAASPTNYLSQQTPQGYLTDFVSGNVSILTLTGAAATGLGPSLTSGFGRSHR